MNPDRVTARMSRPSVDIRGNWSILIGFPGLFRDIESRTCEEFLIRGFGLDEVVSIEIDRKLGSALIHLHPDSTPLPHFLARLAKKLEGSRTRFWPRGRRPYWVLEKDGGRSAYIRAPQPVSGLRRVFYAGLGSLFFGLSIVGVAAPLVPTAPFVILSSYFALRSSPALNHRLLHSRLFGRIVRDWHLHRAMRRSTMNRVLLFMISLFGLTFWLAKPSGPALPTALAISGVSFWLILRVPTVEDREVLVNPPIRSIPVLLPSPGDS